MTSACDGCGCVAAGKSRSGVAENAGAGDGSDAHEPVTGAVGEAEVRGRSRSRISSIAPSIDSCSCGAQSSGVFHRRRIGSERAAS
jgi:hypothetical protein